MIHEKKKNFIREIMIKYSSEQRCAFYGSLTIRTLFGAEKIKLYRLCSFRSFENLDANLKKPIDISVVFP